MESKAGLVARSGNFSSPKGFGPRGLRTGDFSCKTGTVGTWSEISAILLFFFYNFFFFLVTSEESEGNGGGTIQWVIFVQIAKIF